MPITIKVGRKKEELTLHLEARRTLDGNILIFNHDDMDIALLLKEKKILTFPKSKPADSLYDAQNRLFEFLRQKGLIVLDSIRGGNIFGSIEAMMAESTDKDYDTLSYILYGISEFMKHEKPYMDYIEDYEQMMDDYLVEPNAEDSTDLGEVPQAAQKGTIRPGYNYAPYWMSYMLENLKKEEKK
tara:strand:+ start:1141 stop:1695 length:555 start_codon:yes stop_codon:yes gene_type:complete